MAAPCHRPRAPDGRARAHGLVARLDRADPHVLAAPAAVHRRGIPGAAPSGAARPRRLARRLRGRRRRHRDPALAHAGAVRPLRGIGWHRAQSPSALAQSADHARRPRRRGSCRSRAWRSQIPGDGKPQTDRVSPTAPVARAACRPHRRRRDRPSGVDGPHGLPASVDPARLVRREVVGRADGAARVDELLLRHGAGPGALVLHRGAGGVGLRGLLLDVPRFTPLADNRSGDRRRQSSAAERARPHSPVGADAGPSTGRCLSKPFECTNPICSRIVAPTRGT